MREVSGSLLVQEGFQFNQTLHRLSPLAKHELISVMSWTENLRRVQPETHSTIQMSAKDCGYNKHPLHPDSHQPCSYVAVAMATSASVTIVMLQNTVQTYWLRLSADTTGGPAYIQEMTSYVRHSSTACFSARASLSAASPRTTRAVRDHCHDNHKSPIRRLIQTHQRKEQAPCKVSNKYGL